MKKIRKGDDVIVIAGRDAGKRGTVIRMLDKKVVVDGINMVKRHTKPDPNAGKPGGILAKEAPLDISNVMLFNPKSNKGDRVGFLTQEDGTKVRIYKSTNEVVDL